MRKQREGSRRGVGTRNEKSSWLAPGGGPRDFWEGRCRELGPSAPLGEFWAVGGRAGRPGLSLGRSLEQPQGTWGCSSASWTSSELLRKGGTLGLAQGSHEFSAVAVRGRCLSPFSRRGTEGQARGVAAVRYSLSQRSADRVRAWRSALPLASSRAPRAQSVKQGLVSALSPREVQPQGKAAQGHRAERCRARPLLSATQCVPSSRPKGLPGDTHSRGPGPALFAKRSQADSGRQADFRIKHGVCVRGSAFWLRLGN